MRAHGYRNPVRWPVVAECLNDKSLCSSGEIKTKGGGTYHYDWTVGGPAVMRGELEGRLVGVIAETFDLEQG